MPKVSKQISSEACHYLMDILGVGTDAWEKIDYCNIYTSLGCSSSFKK